jgi:AraC family transcriptional regulator, transcriptional activator FtrA
MNPHSQNRHSAERSGHQRPGMTTRRWIRWVAAAIAFVGLPLLVAAGGLHELDRGQHPGLQPLLPHDGGLPAVPRYDPGKPTVAVILGADLTEITDALGPYEMFSRAGAFNVYTVAPEHRPTLLSPILLSGGLRIMPHYSLAELDALLGGKPPAIVVVPNIPNIAGLENKPLVKWMQRQAAAGSLMHSWCTGAMALAEAGLLDGLTATAHWGDLNRLAKRYPRVKWVRGVRWVDHGNVITSAGLTSGIDASLRVLSKVAGEDIAKRVARELRYPNFNFSTEPVVTPYTVEPADAIILANLVFRTPRQQIGVALYDGVGEMDLTGLYDAYAASGATDLLAVAASSSTVRSAHGLILLPSLTASEREADGSIIRHLDRIVVPGRNGAKDGAEVVEALRTLAPALRPKYVHAEANQRFSLEPVVEDLALAVDLPTARFAIRRLEFRSETIRLEGNAVAWGTLPLALGLAVLGAFVALALGRLFRSILLLHYALQAASGKHGVLTARTAATDLEERVST